MDSLSEFATSLTRLIGRPSTLRPFVCNGSPLDCPIMIVGFNAATEMSGDFWNFWDDENGFDRVRWFTEYLKQRKAAPLKRGQQWRASVSSTRRVLDWIVAGAGQTSILETNIYSTASKDIASLRSHQRNSDVFDFLLSTLRPKLVVSHGDDAEQYLRKNFPEVKLRSCAHFSRGWSQIRARQLGRELAQELSAGD